MHDIFINYRNGDEEGTAMAIQRELSRRFGSDQVFFASKSIEPGANYISDLLTAVRNSMVLLAVIGSRWLTAVDKQGRKCLEDENDWVRREILEAFEHGVVVIPVLVGHLQPRLDRSDLPPELAGLAELHAPRLDTHSSERDLRELGDKIAKLVPSLVDSDQPGEPSGPDADGPASETLRAGDHASSQSGGTSTVVSNPLGSMNFYSGSQITRDGVNVAGGNKGGIHQGFGPVRKPSDDR
ncbi:MAG: toll/interleukin-1 receptor domain-containing protein [Pseudonocardiaceae bacterium]